jgi:hypothetical protein
MLYVAIGRGALRARKCGSRTLILDADLRRYLRSLPRLAKSNTSAKTTARRAAAVSKRGKSELAT